MATKIQIRRDTAGNWASAGNPVLSTGEFGYDTTNNVLKLGDGATTWDALAGIADQDFDINDYVTETELNDALAAYYTKVEADAKFVVKTDLTTDLADYVRKTDTDPQNIAGDTVQLTSINALKHCVLPWDQHLISLSQN